MTPAARRSENRARQRDEDFRVLLSSPAGRRMLWWLVEQVGQAFASSFELEPLLMARTEGIRSVGLHLMGEAQRIDSELWLQALAEAVRDKKEQQAQDVADAVHQGDDPDGA